jgi:hypothetical protein
MRKIVGVGMLFVLLQVRIVIIKSIMRTIQFVCKFNNPLVIPCKQSATMARLVRRQLQHLVHVPAQVPVPVPVPVHPPLLFVPRRLLARHLCRLRLRLRLRLLRRRRVLLLVRLSSVLILLQRPFRRRLRVLLIAGLGDRRVMIIRQIVTQRLITSINLSAPTFNRIFVLRWRIPVIMVHS